MVRQLITCLEEYQNRNGLVALYTQVGNQMAHHFQCFGPTELTEPAKNPDYMSKDEMRQHNAVIEAEKAAIKKRMYSNNSEDSCDEEGLQQSCYKWNKIRFR